MLAPILLFVYNRLDILKLCINSLLQNPLSKNSILIIYSDGPKTIDDVDLVFSVRDYVKTIKGFLEIRMIFNNHNMGLANSIINGVTFTINQYGRVIVIEDDLIFSNNFLDYMNSALKSYENHKEVLCISGFSNNIGPFYKQDIYFSKRFSSWGWATWADRWSELNWHPSSYVNLLENPISYLKFFILGTDLPGLLKKRINNNINSWAILFVAHQCINNRLSVHPRISKVKNLGFNHKLATNTITSQNRFNTKIDITGKRNFEFIYHFKINTYTNFYSRLPYTLFIRFLNKLQSYFK
jgi:hypothetical protein